MLIEVIFADHPIAKLHHPVSHIFDGIVMRYHDDGVAVFLVYRLDQLQDFLGGIIIQGSCRLIAKKNIRILYNGSANGSPLLLTAGKLIGKLSLVLIDSQRMEQFIYIQRLITEIGSHLYILPHCKIGDQIIHLKNISQMLTPVQRQILLRHICQTLPVYDQISLVCTVNPTDNIQKRRLTLSCQVISKKNIEFTQKERLPISAIFHNSLS